MIGFFFIASFFFKKSILCLQEQYKTIFLTLYEMFKSSVGVQTAQDYLLKLQLAKNDHPAYNISLGEEFQVSK